MNVSKQFDESVVQTNATPSGSHHFGRALLAHPMTYIVMGICVWLVDVFVGPSALRFPIIFVLPVSLCAWFSNRNVAFALAVFLPLGRMWIAGFYQHATPIEAAEINALTRIAVLVFMAYFVSRSSRQTRLLEHRVKQLQSILPVCMGCQRIRDEHGHWEKLDEYVTEHTDAVVSHGLCPECAQRLYGDVLAESSK